MRALTAGTNGEDVKRWQAFLTEQTLYRGEPHGKFDDETKQATVDFQRLHELHPAEGFVTNRTLGMAMVLGFTIFDEPGKKGGE
jgi:peptidoglycan hydrolase-like protein with peptidoglycan-binding domain